MPIDLNLHEKVMILMIIVIRLWV